MMVQQLNRDMPKSNRRVVDISSFFLNPLRKGPVTLRDGMRILIVYPRRIGDCVMAIPLLTNLRRHYQVHITVMAPKYFKEIMNDQDLFDEFIDFGTCAGPVSGREWLHNRKEIHKTFERYRGEKYDVAIEPFGNCFATLYMRLFKAEFYVGIDIGNLSKLLTFAARYDDDAHITDNILNLYQELGGKVEEELIYPTIVPTRGWQEKEKNLIKKWKLRDQFVVGIHCGASAKIKQWQGYSELVELLVHYREDILILFFGAQEDGEQIHSIIEHSRLPKQSYKIVQCGLRDYIDQIRLCNYIVCNDSSCGHLAAAQGIDATVIYGPYLPVMGTPRGRAHITFISKELPCKPCRAFQCKFGESDIRCLKAISANEVFGLIRHHIEERNGYIN